MKSALLKGSLLLAIGLPVAAVAQDGQPAAQSGGLTDIVVTAQRRAQSLQDVPIAITAVEGDILARAGVVDTGQLAQIAPGISMTMNNNSITPFIRGVGTPTIGPGADSAVAFYVDNMYVVSSTSTILGLNNIERIEVLRGPQGTLFGRNTTGGLVRIVTKDPSHVPELDVSLSYGSYETVSASAYLTGGLTEGVAASIAVMRSSQQKGYGRNVTYDREIGLTDEFAIRGELQLEPTEALSINLAADYSERNSDLGLNRAARPGSWYQDGVQASDNPWLTRANIVGKGEVYQYSFSSEISYAFDWGNIVSNTALFRANSHILYDQDKTPIPIVDVNILQEEHSFQQELLVNAGIGRLDLTAGLFYFSNTALYLPNMTRSAAIPSLNIGRFADLGSRSYAGFAQGTYAITNSTNITAGLRYTRENKTGSGYYLVYPGHTLPPGSLDPAGTTGERRKIGFSRVTWRLAIDQQLNDDIMLYASYNRGFKSGGYSIVNVTQDPVKPEILDAYEAGVKTELFERQLRFNLSGYYYDYSNMQVTQVVAGGTRLLNAARARAHGVELESLFEPRIGFGELSLRVSGAYASGEYRSFPDGPVFLPNPVVDVPAGVTCPAVRPVTPGGNTQCLADLTGNSLTRMPKWSVSAGAEYSIPVGQDVLSFSSDVYHSSSFFFEPSNRLRNPGHTVLNAQIAYGFAGDKVSVRVFGRNLTKARYYNYGAESALGDPVVPGTPRFFGVGVDVRFGGE